MKNNEKYAKEIIEIACDWYNIAINKNTGKPEKCCLSFNCTECLFSRDSGSCNSSEKIREWAESEYIEKPVISKRDRAFLEYISKKYRYIARDDKDESGEELFAWNAKPKKGSILNEWLDKDNDAIGLYGFNIDFPMVKWSDSEPWLIEDLKKLEVVEEYEI